MLEKIVCIHNTECEHKGYDNNCGEIICLYVYRRNYVKHRKENVKQIETKRNEFGVPYMEGV